MFFNAWKVKNETFSQKLDSSATCWLFKRSQNANKPCWRVTVALLISRTGGKQFINGHNLSLLPAKHYINLGIEKDFCHLSRSTLLFSIFTIGKEHTSVWQANINVTCNSGCIDMKDQKFSSEKLYNLTIFPFFLNWQRGRHDWVVVGKCNKM